MHEIAEATPVAFSVFVLTTTGFAEVGHRREFGIERTP